MLKSIFICLLLLQGANSQPAKQQSASEQQRRTEQVSRTPSDDRHVETTNDGVTKSFQQTQTNQYWFLIGTGVATFVVLIFYTAFAGLQWWQIRKQGQQAAEGLKISTRAYVGIHSIETELTRDSQPRPKTLVVRIENIGKIPAEDIKVSSVVSMLTPTGRWAGNPRAFYAETFTDDFKRAKLFPGSLKFEIPIPLMLYFSNPELTLIAQQIAIFTTSVKIEYKDGFNASQQSDFFFHYFAGANKWIPRAVASPEELQKEQADKQRGQNPK